MVREWFGKVGRRLVATSTSFVMMWEEFKKARHRLAGMRGRLRPVSPRLVPTSHFFKTSGIGPKGIVEFEGVPWDCAAKSALSGGMRNGKSA